MGKKKEALQEENTLQQEAAAAEELLEQQAAQTPAAEEAPSEEAPAEEAPAEEAKDKEEISVIVLAHPGTELLVKRIWEKHFQGTVNVLSFSGDDRIAEGVAVRIGCAAGVLAVLVGKGGKERSGIVAGLELLE